MPTKQDRPIAIRLFNCVCSLVLIGALVCILIVGIEKITAILLVASVISVAVPVVIAGGSLLEVFVGILEAFVEGVMLVVDVITSIISGLFG